MAPEQIATDVWLLVMFRALRRATARNLTLSSRIPPVIGKVRGLSVAHTLSASPSSILQESDRAQLPHGAPFPRRSHTCGALSSGDVGSTVVLTGWLLPERKVNHKLSFFNLRDSYGIVQLVVSAKEDEALLAMMRKLPTESTVSLRGAVRMRAEGHRRPYPQGDIEVAVVSCLLLNPADRNLPFLPSDTQNMANENVRLRYRYLDLRREALSANLKKRSEAAHLIRSVFYERDFTEVETPILLKSTPEGAREFLVPTRLTGSPSSSSPGQSAVSSTTKGLISTPLFYALPQSPQQPKQLLVASGAVDRYYQLAKCFRDEDGRKDRQPEFTQVDLEMAWVSWGEPDMSNDVSAPMALIDADDSPTQWRIGGLEVRETVEALVRRLWSKLEGIELPEQFQVTTYDTAMHRYGCDKPDLRVGMEIEDISSYLPTSVRAALTSREEIVEALVVRASTSDRAFLRAARELRSEEKTVERLEVAQNGSIDWIRQSEIIRRTADFAVDDVDMQINTALHLNSGDILWVARRRGRPEGGSTALGRLRLQLAGLAETLGDFTFPDDPRFLWVTEFPLFTRADADKEFLAHGRWSSSHHPFTAPMWQDIKKMYEGGVAEVRGQHYDLVLNGVEIGGGSVRVHDAGMQEYIFTEILQASLDRTETTSFAHLLHALRCGAPPHGGFAFGFDRLMAILCKTDSIRDVIAFPKTSVGTDLLFKSPAPASREVLAQYGIPAK
ncbi:uncharacterized protein FIBRA_05530 [Fibroporia radiculosa]|uniref:Aminoacyl-transfer RNA synthetases class-II family profile domain-containing protein n=1 Tax=Fibroporia radiculosa TaxID=599839 RepID=J4H3K4_9APHY|nr:uncharacterized protein FIBRA_05530 [Fibroporia radiculosa]CCM03399.1 predicted protein [Fibroporia radiculosa]